MHLVLPHHYLITNVLTSDANIQRRTIQDVDTITGHFVTLVILIKANYMCYLRYEPGMAQATEKECKHNFKSL